MKKNKPVIYWLAKYLIRHHEDLFSFSDKVVMNWFIESWFNSQSKAFGGVCATGSTVSRKWRELKELYYENCKADYSDPYFRFYNQFKINYPQFTRSTNTWTLPKEFISWLKIFVKRWEG